MKRAAKKDANHGAIVQALESVGAYVKDTSQLKHAFDILVAYRCKLYVMEIKNPEYLPKQYDRERLEKALEDGECKCMVGFQSVGVTYHIVATIDEALEIIGAKQIKTINQNIKTK